MQLTIYNSEDLTLVRETRLVTFKKGVNPLQFSWANTLIDPSSVELKFLSHADKLDVLDTTFPHDKPQMLYWNVNSEIDGEAAIQITYFTSGITWSPTTCAWPTKTRGKWASRASCGLPTTAARSTKMPRCGWWWATSIWWKKSPSWRKSR